MSGNAEGAAGERLAASPFGQLCDCRLNQKRTGSILLVSGHAQLRTVCESGYRQQGTAPLALPFGIVFSLSL